MASRWPHREAATTLGRGGRYGLLGTATLWIVPWVFYGSTVVFTLAGTELGQSAPRWMRAILRHDWLQLLAGFVVGAWIVSRLTLLIRKGSVGLVALGILLELPIAFVVYSVWCIGMIGGPINPG